MSRKITAKNNKKSATTHCNNARNGCDLEGCECTCDCKGCMYKAEQEKKDRQLVENAPVKTGAKYCTKCPFGANVHESECKVHCAPAPASAIVLPVCEAFFEEVTMTSEEETSQEFENEVQEEVESESA